MNFLSHIIPVSLTQLTFSNVNLTEYFTMTYWRMKLYTNDLKAIFMNICVFKKSVRGTFFRAERLILPELIILLTVKKFFFLEILCWICVNKKKALSILRNYYRVQMLCLYSVNLKKISWLFCSESSVRRRILQSKSIN